MTAPETQSGFFDFKRRFSALIGAAGTTGLLPLGILIGLATVTGFDSTAFGVLAPDIRHTFHISTGTTDAIASLTGAVPIMLSVYIGVLGDRMNRIGLSFVAGLIWGVTAILT